MEPTLEEWKKRALEAEEALAKSQHHSGSHHGDPILTTRDIELLKAYNKWTTIYNKHYSEKYSDHTMKLPGNVDWLKSRLFWRIRSGKEPLPFPPPTCYSCPWYELIETPGAHCSAEQVYAHDEGVYVGQCRYDLLGKDGDKFILGYGPYRFLAWNGPIMRKRLLAVPKEDGTKFVEYEDTCAWIEYTGTESGK